jgi:glycosyltransferase involved in cell wall biosynthesis
MKEKTLIWVFCLLGPDTPNFRLRLSGPLGYLPQDEFEVIYAPSLKAIVRLLRLPDIILIHRHFYPLDETEKIVEFARSRAITTVMDVDDLITQLPAEHPGFPDFKKMQPALTRLLRNVDVVTVTNARLKQYYADYNPAIHILPNLLDERIWSGGSPEKRAKDNRLVIGYAGSQSHTYDFQAVIPAIRHILTEYDDKVSFKFMGYIPDGLRGAPGICHISDPVDSYRQYADILMKSEFDITLAPLKNNAFNQCKSNIKFLEYSACGYPGIYSAVGPYADSVTHNETGLLVDNTTEAWASAMESLINDAALRGKLGQNACRHVKTDYSLQKRSKEWLQLYGRIGPARKKGGRLSLSPTVKYGPYVVYQQLRRTAGRIRRAFSRRF